MKKPEEVMEILEAYDLTGSFRQAAANSSDETDQKRVTVSHEMISHGSATHRHICLPEMASVAPRIKNGTQRTGYGHD